ncbi:leucine-rich repeat domain-containing protein [Pedobacter sp. JY14-1]|uniref:leucine-rich repeat domain-containing protein n=1 Tax=Pedobacter sp. JY14-1 TaxID=3034151 RepID=UPI0023E2E561|nr:leucine-rich repeat domain-containing protein [Pedobacter sp. JY14-1]
MKKIFALFLCLFFGKHLQAQDIDRLFDEYRLQERYPNPITIWNGINRNPLPGKLFLNPRLLENAEHFPKIIVVNHLTDIKAIQKQGIAEKVRGLIVTVRDSSEFIHTINEIVKFPDLQYLHIGGEPGIVDKTYVHEHENRYRLPDNITQLNKLEIVAFTGGLADLDDAFRKLSGLKSLKALALYNVYKPIPATLTTLKQVRLLHLFNGNLLGLDLSTVPWESVRILRAENPVLTSLSGIKSLKTLEINYPRQIDPELLLKFKHLNRLSISEPGFNGKELMGKIRHMRHLNWLKLSLFDSLNLTGISALRFLKHLELVSRVPSEKHPENLAELARLYQLEELKLGAYRAPWIPDIFNRLKSLKLLSVRSGERNLPGSIFRLPKLDSLIISGEGIIALPELPAYGFQKLKVLRINSTGLSKLPKAVLHLPELEVLDLSGNQLLDMPDDGWELKKLRTLSVENNRLDYLPSTLGNTTALQFLNAANNRIRQLPASLGKCRSLRQLILDNNDLSLLPEELAAADSLEMLKLSNNPNVDGASLWKVVLAAPRKNFILDASRTGLRNLPESDRWQHIKLTDLNLSNNKLKTLPVSFGQVGDFDRILLSGNPLSMPQQLANVRIVSRADLKVLFYELGMSSAVNPVPDKEFALVLLDRIAYLKDIEDWARIIAFADLAVKSDPQGYQDSWYTAYIGIAKYKTKNYAGAIKELENFLALDRSTYYAYPEHLTNVELCLYDAYIALGKRREAAKIRPLFVSKMSDPEIFYTFLNHYLDSKDLKSIKELMERALPAYKENLLRERQPDGNISPSFLCEYAEVLLIAGKPQEAATLLTSMADENYRSSYISIKNCLLAMADYLSKAKTYEEAKADLTASIARNRKISAGFWSFETLNRWTAFSNKPELEQENLKSLQQIAMATDDKN